MSRLNRWNGWIGLRQAGRRLSARFGTLRWRLSFSYFMTALVALFLLEMAFVGVPSIVVAFTVSAPQHPVALVQGLEKLAPQAAPYLSQTPPDRAGLANWLHTHEVPVASFSSGVPVDKESSYAVVPGQNAVLWVVNSSGAPVATLAPSSASAGEIANWQNLGAARTVIAAALANQTNQTNQTSTTSTTALLQRLPDGRAVAAAPVRDSAGVVRGALVLGVDLVGIQRATAVTGIIDLFYAIVPFTLIASVLGALVGLLMARGLTRRLRRLAVAADAWSRGDFAASARDSSTDELGQLARDLNRMAEQLQMLLRDRQQLAVMEERNRLARDLHDSVKQQIFAVTMLVGSARLEAEANPEAERILAEAERISSNAQQELTALIHALRPVALAGKGLSAALCELCGDWSRRTGIATEARIADGLVLAPAAEEEVFRTVQEALANIARHSGATEVRVVAERAGEQLALRIEDNGHGFNVALANGGQGVGLRSMRERIEGLGGTLFIFSGADGTRVEASLPLSSPTAGEAPPVTTEAQADATNTANISGG